MGMCVACVVEYGSRQRRKWCPVWSASFWTIHNGRWFGHLGVEVCLRIVRLRFIQQNCVATVTITSSLSRCSILTPQAQAILEQDELDDGQIIVGPDEARQ
ncbi:uncharacterized protein SPSK_02021 [Sporothrix schenckii 1099-18]|uniref:Uncharacterized protein n=1 Tax=Sporothrix schenckii 1099-18 TaxID=1397361 RepID=A0A0F2MGF2_SPOSC|nr:uncharacterized protein SPSK_02021 [Sporothrix schenckii 1099-18]KJR87241.1 hypothetical protein SPSK_02021 [Sporothrix schenckii 1099-18]